MYSAQIPILLTSHLRWPRSLGTIDSCGSIGSVVLYPLDKLAPSSPLACNKACSLNSRLEPEGFPIYNAASIHACIHDCYMYLQGYIHAHTPLSVHYIAIAGITEHLQVSHYWRQSQGARGEISSYKGI